MHPELFKQSSLEKDVLQKLFGKKSIFRVFRSITKSECKQSSLKEDDLSRS